MLTMTPLGDRLKDARRRAALTQGELAEKSGVGVTTIVRIERGQIEEPRVTTIRKLAQALDVPTAQLVGED
jgi:transcriptional regulator with XRE-family HTH domain